MQVITLSGLGGAQSIVIHLANGFSKQGHEVCVVSSSAGRMWDSLAEGVIKKVCSYLKREIDAISDIKAIFRLREIYNEVQPDIVHLHSSKAGALGRIALGKYKTKIVYTVHGFDTILKANRLFLPVEKILSSKAKHIITVCDYDRRSLTKQGIYNVCTIKNGIPDINQQNFLKNPFEEARNAEKKVVLSIARLMPPKRFDLFREVADAMTNEAVMFYWIGNQNSVKDLPANVRCLGEIPSAAKVIKFADVFALFSNYEGLPISIIESLSSSVPVVASDVGGIAEILNEENGKAVKNFPNEAVKALSHFLFHEDILANARKAARSTYEKEFTVDKMLKSYMNLYEKCLDDPCRDRW